MTDRTARVDEIEKEMQTFPTRTTIYREFAEQVTNAERGHLIALCIKHGAAIHVTYSPNDGETFSSVRQGEKDE